MPKKVILFLSGYKGNAREQTHLCPDGLIFTCSLSFSGDFLPVPMGLLLSGRHTGLPADQIRLDHLMINLPLPVADELHQRLYRQGFIRA